MDKRNKKREKSRKNISKKESFEDKITRLKREFSEALSGSSFVL